MKQVVRVATGSEPGNSIAARAILQRLGFQIHGTAVGRSGVSRAPNVAMKPSPFDLDALVVVDAVDASVSFSWHRAGQLALGVDGNPQFPPLPDLPGLYRFDCGLDEQGIRTLYIGESKSIRKRGRYYRMGNPRQRTSHRIHKEVAGHLSAGGAIDFAITTRVTINGSAADLGQVPGRGVTADLRVDLG